MSFGLQDNPEQLAACARSSGSWDHARDIEVEGKTAVPYPLLFDEKVCIFEKNDLVLRSLQDGRYLWKVPMTSGFIPYFHAHDAVYVTLNGRAHVIDAATGQMRAVFSDPCARVTSYSDKSIFARHEKRCAIAFDQVGRERLWTFEGSGFLDNILCSSGVVIVNATGREAGTTWRISALRETDGFVLASVNAHELRESDSRFRTLAGWSKGEAYKYLLGPIIDESVLVLFSDGNVVRLRLADLSVVWVAHLVGQPQTVIRHGDKLFACLDQGFGNRNVLTVINWSTGDLIQDMKNNFTPSGLRNPIMIGRFLIGGAHADVACYDVESGTFTWRFNDGVPRFGGGMWASGKWLASRDLKHHSNKLHVFKVRSPQ